MIQLLKLEWRTALKGWVLSTVIIFPFTFIPTFFEQGNLSENLISRVPESLAYALGFALFIVIAAIYQNYERQSKKIKYFNKPALRSLDFIYKSSGKGSLYKDFSFHLEGEFNENQYSIDFSINLEETDKDKILIIPGFLIRGSQLPQLKQKLDREFNLVMVDNILAVAIDVEEINLKDDKSVKKSLTLIDSAFQLALAKSP